MNKEWIDKKPDINIVNSLRSQTNTSHAMASALVNRDIHTFKQAIEFLKPDINKLHNPFLLKGMAEAVERINKAIDTGEKICIHGDYDVDGISATTILLKTFSKLNYEAIFYLPNRLLEGYGISKKGIDRIKTQGVDLIISVDCGITSIEEVEYAKILGIDMIISDHHQELEGLKPDAISVINPHQEGCKYQFKELAGVAVAFKIAQALIPDLLEHDDILEFMNIVAFGSVADIVSMRGENRIFGTCGISNMGETTNIGLNALISESGIKDKKITAGQLGFNIAPKVNATGRIGEPRLGVELLMSEDIKSATSISKKLCAINEERQVIERDITAQCIEIVESDDSYKNDKVLIISGKDWQTGIIGICASKVGEKYHKPIFILSEGLDGITKGSGRSISGFNLLGGLDYSKEVLGGYGGHEQACGLSLPTENIPQLRKLINIHADQVLTDEDMIPKIKYECEFSLEDIDFNLMKELKYLEPFGVSNPTPIFMIKNLTVVKKILMGKEKEHLKLMLSDGNNQIDAIQFNYDCDVKDGDNIKLLGNLNINEFRGVENIQIFIKDIKQEE